MDIRTASMEGLKVMRGVMRGVGQVKARSIVEWRDAGEITMVLLITKTNITQATWAKWHGEGLMAKWHGEGLILIPGMAKEELRDDHAEQWLEEDKLLEIRCKNVQ